jgi:hypothetical protein
VRGRPRSRITGLGAGFTFACGLVLSLACALVGSGCQKPTALVFQIEAPPNPLLDPFQGNVSDYLLKTDEGVTIAAVSAGAGVNSKGELALGTLDPTLAGDLRLDVLSGTELVGRAMVTSVAITKGKTDELTAAVRKPLVVVGSAAAPEAAGPVQAAQLLDVTTATDLAKRGVVVPIGTASGFSEDGRALVVTGSTGLTVIDTGTGTNNGPATLPFTPQALAIARDDQALAVVERTTGRGRVLIYTNVASLLSSPKTAQPITASLPASGLARTAHFSVDGKTLYVLIEASTDEPCTGTTAPATNSIIPVSTTGTVGAAIAMPSYVADFGVDATGHLILSEAGGNRISTLTLSADGQTSVGAATKLYAATCPTALRLLDQQVFAVTNDVATGTTNTFALLSGKLDGSTATMLPIAKPQYVTEINQSSTPDGLTNINLAFTSIAIAATDMAVSPDGSRAVIATRARYREDGSASFMFVGLSCTAITDIVEYGFISADLVTATASYVSRSQNTLVPTAPTTTACVNCAEDLGGFQMLTLGLPCPPVPGDRATGLAAAFSGSP